MFKTVHNYLRGALSGSPQFLQSLRCDRVAAYGVGGEFDRFLGQVSDGKHFQGVARLKVGAPYFTSEQHLAQHGRANWANVDSRLQLFAARLVEAARKENVPLYVHAALRTKEEQNAAYERGNSKLRWPRAPHCQGKAVDIVHSIYHWQLTDDEWRTLGHMGKKIAHKMSLRLNWGGDETIIPAPYGDPADTFRWDPAHWEIHPWAQEIHEWRSTPAIRKTPRKILAEQRGAD